MPIWWPSGFKGDQQSARQTLLKNEPYWQTLILPWVRPRSCQYGIKPFSVTCRNLDLCGQMAVDSGPIQYCMDDTKPDGSCPCIMGFILAEKSRELVALTPQQRSVQCHESYHQYSVRNVSVTVSKSPNFLAVARKPYICTFCTAYNVAAKSENIS